MTTDEEITTMSDRRPQDRRGGVVAWLRQLIYPEDFRIAPAPGPDEVRMTRALADRDERILALREQNRALATDLEALKEQVGAVDHTSDDAALVDAAMGLWRLRQRLAKLDGDATTRGLRRSLTTAWDGLEKLGVAVQEHDRQPYDTGMRVEALDFQPEPGLSREIIIETVQPTIYRFDRAIQQGQVIVGQPEGGQHS